MNRRKFFSFFGFAIAVPALPAIACAKESPLGPLPWPPMVLTPPLKATKDELAAFSLGNQNDVMMLQSHIDARLRYLLTKLESETVTIHLSGETFGRKQVRAIVEQINARG